MDTPATDISAALDSLNTYDRRVFLAYVDHTDADDDARRLAQFAATGHPALEARLSEVDTARQYDVVRTVRRAAEGGYGWQGSPVDVGHLYRALKLGRLTV
jgi:hypothetical protein